MAQLQDLWTSNQLRVLRGLDVPVWVSAQDNAVHSSTLASTTLGLQDHITEPNSPNQSLGGDGPGTAPQHQPIKLDKVEDQPSDQSNIQPNQIAPVTLHAPVYDMPYNALKQAISTCELCQFSTQGQRLLSQATIPRQGGCLVILDVNFAQSSSLLSDQAHSLLSAMLGTLGYSDSTQILLTSALKCKPVDPKIDPIGDEVVACAPYLERQIVLMQPTLILALGEGAAQAIMGLDVPMDELRGELHTFECDGYSGQLLVSYHPEQALQTPALKRSIWQDWCLVLADKVQ